jgi:hypothetical protein
MEDYVDQYPIMLANVISWPNDLRLTTYQFLITGQTR